MRRAILANAQYICTAKVQMTIQGLLSPFFDHLDPNYCHKKGGIKIASDNRAVKCARPKSVSNFKGITIATLPHFTRTLRDKTG